MVLLNVFDDRSGDQVPDAHFPSEEKPDLGAADVVLNQLLDDMDIITPWLQGSQRFVNIGSVAFDNESLGFD
jgi:hypothetical protein